MIRRSIVLRVSADAPAMTLEACNDTAAWWNKKIRKPMATKASTTPQTPTVRGQTFPFPTQVCVKSPFGGIDASAATITN